MAPALTPVDHPAMGALGRAIERVWGATAALHPGGWQRAGGGARPGAGGAGAVPRRGLPGDRIHAPNERMVMDQFWKGLVAAGELLLELGGR